MDTLEVLNGSGHLTLTWNPDDATEVARAREEVAKLKAAGYQFFLVDDGPADEVVAGHGSLIVKRLEDPTEAEAPIESPKHGRRSVAVRPLQGG